MIYRKGSKQSDTGTVLPADESYRIRIVCTWSIAQTRAGAAHRARARACMVTTPKSDADGLERGEVEGSQAVGPGQSRPRRRHVSVTGATPSRRARMGARHMT